MPENQDQNIEFLRKTGQMWVIHWFIAFDGNVHYSYDVYAVLASQLFHIPVHRVKQAERHYAKRMLWSSICEEGNLS